MNILRDHTAPSLEKVTLNFWQPSMIRVLRTSQEHAKSTLFLPIFGNEGAYTILALPYSAILCEWVFLPPILLLSLLSLALYSFGLSSAGLGELFPLYSLAL